MSLGTIFWGDCFKHFDGPKKVFKLYKMKNIEEPPAYVFMGVSNFHMVMACRLEKGCLSKQCGPSPSEAISNLLAGVVALKPQPLHGPQWQPNIKVSDNVC